MKIIFSKAITNYRKSVLKSSLLLLFLINFTDVEGQVLDKLKSTARHPKVDSSMTVLASTEPNTLRIEFHPPNRDTVFVREYKDSIGRFDFNLSHTASQINIQYVNDTLWYIYGTRTEYAYYPSILRTTNSGESWQTIMQSWPDKFDQPMGKNMFHMFDIANGIWVIELHNNKINYRITNDGGYTWKNRHFKIKNNSISKTEQKSLHIKYSDNNSMQISIKYHLKKDGKWTISSINSIYESVNLGRKFKKVN
jgi:hypothetical protein